MFNDIALSCIVSSGAHVSNVCRTGAGGAAHTLDTLEGVWDGRRPATVRARVRLPAVSGPGGRPALR